MASKTRLIRHIVITELTVIATGRTRSAWTISWTRQLTSLAAAMALLGVPGAVHARASANFVVGNGTTESCTESALDDALGLAQLDGGGTVLFNCGGAATISLTTQKILTSAGPIRIEGGALITLDANGATRPFLVESPTQLTLDSLMVRGGAVAGGGGAAVVRNGARLIVQHATFTANQASSGAGGAIAGDSGSTIMIDNSTFSGNTAHAAGGAISANGALTISNSTFSGNSVSANGGAIAASGTALISNTLLYSNIASNPAATGNGGAIWSSGSVTINRSQILSNSADFGGGISVLTGTLAVLDSVVGHNLAAHFDTACSSTCLGGGGIAIRRGELSIRRTLLEHNRAIQRIAANGTDAGNGGAVFSWDGNVSIAFSTLRFNAAREIGGAAYAARNIGGGQGSADISNSWIYSNTASAGGGVALLYTYYVQGGIGRTVFEQNVATGGRGGALYDAAAPASSLMDVTFLANRASQGGAIYAEGNGERFVLNTTFSGNAAQYGGAISYYNGSTANRLRLQSSTFANNSSALAGGAIAVGVNGGIGVVVLNKVVITPGVQGVNCTVNTGSVISATASYSADATCGAATLLTGTALGPLIDGGPRVGSPGNERRMPVHIPAAGSPVLDKAATCDTIADQRGKPRPQDGDGNGNALCDIGAVERQPDDDNFTVRLPLVQR